MLFFVLLYFLFLLFGILLVNIIIVKIFIKKKVNKKFIIIGKNFFFISNYVFFYFINFNIMKVF